MLFTDRSLWTMVHGIVLRGGALMGMIRLAVSFALVSFVGLMGIFVDKVAPLH